MPDDETPAAVLEAREKVRLWGEMCHRCRAGHEGECITRFDQAASCPGAAVELEDYLSAVRTLEVMLEPAAPSRKRGKRSDAVQPPTEAAEAEVASRWDSGYIDPSAWVFKKDIGDFRDPESTGRKAIDDLYPIQPGQICDWAWKRGCGGGVVPILGCPGHPASDLHHGPDKNTLNNAKVSRGIGRLENAWAICSFCHNDFHAKNDAYYPPYDRVAQQAQPWLPQYPEGFTPFVMEDADPDEVLAQEARRKKEHARHGVTRLGRNARAAGPAEHPDRSDDLDPAGVDELAE
jgi:hypothetical protein